MSELEVTKKRVKKRTTLFQEIMYLLIKIAFILVIVCFLFTFMFGLLRYNSGNMSPAVHSGDLIMFYRLDKSYAVNDLLLVKYEDAYQIQRVAAKSGDVVDITEEGLTINGSLQYESNIYTETTQFSEGITFPLTVGEGQIFVLSDNRENATDSRIYGCISESDTYGTVMAVIRRRNF